MRFHDVLRAAATLSECSIGDLSTRTGIRRSRIERVLAGRTLPKGDDASRILTACKVDPRLLTSPATFRVIGDVVTATYATSTASLLPMDLLLGLLIHRSEDPTLATVDEGSLAIDRLSLTFDARNAAEFVARAASLGSAARSARPIYAHEYRCPRGIFVQHGSTPHASPRFLQRRSSRIEINPSRFLGHAKSRALFAELLSFAIPQSTRISRIDVAVDLPVSIRRVQALGAPRQKVNVFFGAAGVETIYCGTQKSERQVRIYDRRQKLVDDGGALTSAHPITRFEAQLRNVGLTVDGLLTLHNPFSRLRLLDLRAEALPLSQRVLAHYARAFGLPALKAELDAAEFAALVAVLDVLALSPALPHPSTVFEDRWRQTAQPLQRLLQASLR
jgi:hypothetical protein